MLMYSEESVETVSMARLFGRPVSFLSCRSEGDLKV